MSVVVQGDQELNSTELHTLCSTKHLGKSAERNKSCTLEESVSHLVRNNHGNGLTYDLGSMAFVEPKDFTLCSITASFWHEAQPSQQKESIEVTYDRKQT
jgi:hypothetical protein